MAIENAPNTEWGHHLDYIGVINLALEQLKTMDADQLFPGVMQKLDQLKLKAVALRSLEPNSPPRGDILRALDVGHSSIELALAFDFDANRIVPWDGDLSPIHRLRTGFGDKTALGRAIQGYFNDLQTRDELGVALVSTYSRKIKQMATKLLKGEIKPNLDSFPYYAMTRAQIIDALDDASSVRMIKRLFPRAKFFLRDALLAEYDSRAARNLVALDGFSLVEDPTLRKKIIADLLLSNPLAIHNEALDEIIEVGLKTKLDIHWVNSLTKDVHVGPTNLMKLSKTLLSEPEYERPYRYLIDARQFSSITTDQSTRQFEAAPIVFIGGVDCIDYLFGLYAMTADENDSITTDWEELNLSKLEDLARTLMKYRNGVTFLVVTQDEKRAQAYSDFLQQIKRLLTDNKEAFDLPADIDMDHAFRIEVETHKDVLKVHRAFIEPM